MNEYAIQIQTIEKKIFLIRGHKVMLDTHLADLYGVEEGQRGQSAVLASCKFLKFQHATCKDGTIFPPKTIAKIGFSRPIKVKNETIPKIKLATANSLVAADLFSSMCPPIE